jgi:hypothetical protein
LQRETENNQHGRLPVKVEGCMDETMYNYDSTANIDDDSCMPHVYGCTDSDNCAYNAEATTDDGTCVDDTVDADGKPQPGVCIFGCMDDTYYNYNSA